MCDELRNRSTKPGSKDTLQMNDLTDKTILITGSTDGVGRTIARAFGALGSQVLVHGRDRARGQQVVGEIRRDGGQATFHAADLSSLDEVRRLAAVVGREHPRLDVLINNAGIGSASGG